MPYLPEEMKAVIDPQIDHLAEGIKAHPKKVGAFNYAINRIAVQAFERSYFGFVCVVGTILLALLEFWWRVVRDYESDKVGENGDINWEGKG